MTSWCPKCDDQQTDVPETYDRCIKCGGKVGLSDDPNKIIAKAQLRPYIESVKLQRLLQKTIPNIDMLS